MIFVVAMVGALWLGASSASAYPGQASACNDCHSYPSTYIKISTDSATKTVNAGQAFTVTISWTGGGSTTEINWPSDFSNIGISRDNNLFSPTPRIPYSGGNTSGTTSSVLTAPSAPGSYIVRVYGARKSPRETDYKDIAITVSTPPVADTTGPLTSSVAAGPNPTAGASSVELTATVSDATTGNSNIAAAEYFIDTTGGSGTAMSASDGAFSSATEGVTATVDVSALSTGTHTLYVRGRDAAGNWGTTASTTLSVSAPPIPVPDTTGPLTSSVSVRAIRNTTTASLKASISDLTTGGSSIAAAEYFIDVIGADGAGIALDAVDGSFGSVTEAAKATIDISGLAAGRHKIYVHGQDSAGNWGPVSVANLRIRAVKPR